MTNKKRKPIKREVLYMYRLLLKKNGVVLNLKKIVGFYDDYNDLYDRVKNHKYVPAAVKYNVVGTAKVPKYLQWVKQYMI